MKKRMLSLFILILLSEMDPALALADPQMMTQPEHPSEVGLTSSPSNQTIPNLDSEKPLSFRWVLHQIAFESSATQVKIKIEGSGGLSHLREQKLSNPGRLLLEIPQIENASNLNLHELTDHLMIPRIRLAQHFDSLRIIIDTVLSELPPYTLQKNDHEMTLSFNKTPEMIAEGESRAELFTAMQQGDREAILKMGSEDEGGILFADGQSSLNHSGNVRSGASSSSASLMHNESLPPGVRVESQNRSTSSNRVVFLLDDRQEYKIYIQETQTPIHIEKIRPAYEIRGVQTRLSKLGYNLGQEDGSIGPLTRKALKEFQQKHGLPINGTPTKKTQQALKKEFGY